MGLQITKTVTVSWGAGGRAFVERVAGKYRLPFYTQLEPAMLEAIQASIEAALKSDQADDVVPADVEIEEGDQLVDGGRFLKKY